MKHLLAYSYLMGAVILAGGASFAGTEYSATYQSGRFTIPTIKQFEEKVRDIHPTLDIKQIEVADIEYRGTSYKAMSYSVNGVKNSTQYVQLTSYIRVLPGLWKLLFVESKNCSKGTTLNKNQEWQEKWICDVSPFPFSGFDDLFLVENESVTAESIQEMFTDPVLAYQGPETKEVKDQTFSIGDLALKLESLGSTYFREPTQYTAPGQVEAVDAILFKVAGPLEDGKRVEQSFVYIVDGDRLRLKEIDGVICRFVKRIGKEICDPIHVPTPATPMPLELLNSMDPTGAFSEAPASQPITEIPTDRRCGPLKGHLESILKVHFQRSFLDGANPAEYVRFLKNYPTVADPMGLLMSANEKDLVMQEILSGPDSAQNISRLVEEFGKGSAGDCSQLVSLMAQFKAKILDKSAKVFQLINAVKNEDLDLDVEAVNFDSYQQALLSRLPALLHPQLVQANKKAAIDVALNKVKDYVEQTLDRLSDLEKFTVQAMASQDIYSTMIPMQGELANTLLGHKDKKYFGLSVDRGFSGNHYVFRVSGAAQKAGMRPADRLVKINGVEAKTLSFKQVDNILLDTDKPIEFELDRQGQIFTLNLEAQSLNPLRFFFSVEYAQENGKGVLTIDLKSFEPGIVPLIYDDVQQILSESQVDLYVLNLENNPGGNNQETMNLASLFVRNRPVAFSKTGSRNFAQLKVHDANPEFFIDDQTPLLVKINRGSMSASEIVASNLQSLKRSVTVGEQSHGKLIGQFYIPLALQSKQSYGLLITAVEYFTTTGKALNSIGVTPDILTSDFVNTEFDDGVGPGKDIEPDQLPEVETYNFSKEDILKLGVNF